MANIVLNDNSIVIGNISAGTSGVPLQAETSVIGQTARFKSLASSTSAFTVTPDAINDIINFNIVPGEIAHGDLANSGTITHANIDLWLPTSDQKDALTNPLASATDKFVTASELAQTDFRVNILSGDTPGFLSTKVLQGNGIKITTEGTTNLNLRISGDWSADPLSTISEPVNANSSPVAPTKTYRLADENHTHTVETLTSTSTLGKIGGPLTVGSSNLLVRADHNHILRESGGQDLQLGNINSGEWLKRDGTLIISEALPDSDGKVLSNSDDDTRGFLGDKIISGANTGITVSLDTLGVHPNEDVRVKLQLNSTEAVSLIDAVPNINFVTEAQKSALNSSNNPSAINEYITRNDLSTATLALNAVSVADITPSTLSDNVTTDTGILTEIINPGGNEQLRFYLDYQGSPVNVNAAPASIGISTTPSKSDHKHSIDVASAGAIGLANSEGVSESLARADHDHKLKEFGGTELTLGTINDNEYVKRSGTTLVGESSNLADSRVKLRVSDSISSYLENKINLSATSFTSAITSGAFGEKITYSPVFGTSAGNFVEGNTTLLLTSLERAGLTAVATPITGSNPVVTAADLASATGTVDNGANVGTSVGNVFRNKTTNILNFKTIGSANTALTVTNGVDDITLTFNVGNVNHQNLSGAGTQTHAQIDTHIADTTIHTSLGASGPSGTGLLAGSSGTKGVAVTAARSDHTHSVPVAAPSPTGTRTFIGTADTFSRSDHEHALKIEESGGGEVIVEFGEIDDGELLKRVGLEIKSVNLFSEMQYLNATDSIPLQLTASAAFSNVQTLEIPSLAPTGSYFVTTVAQVSTGRSEFVPELRVVRDTVQIGLPSRVRLQDQDEVFTFNMQGVVSHTTGVSTPIHIEARADDESGGVPPAITESNDITVKYSNIAIWRIG